MPHCVTIEIEHRQRPPHLCYATLDDAGEALRAFVPSIDQIPDSETVLISDNGKTIEFLKRDFVLAEMNIVRTAKLKGAAS